MKHRTWLLVIWMALLSGAAFGVLALDHRSVNAIGVVLPRDAAAPASQVIRAFQREGRYMEHFLSVYQGMEPMWLVAEPLVRRDKDFRLLPAAAERWEVSEDGLTWTFSLRRQMRFSDGRPLTAHDYAFSFRRGADPRTGYDAEFYYHSIKNWQRVVAGQRPLSDLGVQALDDYTLAITTATPTPYLPQLMTFSHVSPRQAIQKYGDAWSTRAETFVSSGPFLVQSWTRRDTLVLRANPLYHGLVRPFLEKIIYKLYIPASPPPALSAYQADEVDYTPVTTQAELSHIQSDPILRQELHPYPDFATYYLAMNTLKPPFNNLLLRQAISHAIDRQALVYSALRGVATPAYSMLPSGFPAADPEGLQSIQRYDPHLARQQLAQAGHPDGKGLPPLELWLRDEGKTQQQAAEAIQAMLKQNLGITVVVQNMERKVFMDALNSYRLTFGMTSYVYDFYDPVSLLGIWRSKGRHAWRHDTFDRLLIGGGSLINAPQQRLELYQQAERILVSDVGAVFLWHPRINALWKSYIQGEALEPNRFGYRVWRNDGLLNLSTTIYITKSKESLSPMPHAQRGFWGWFSPWRLWQD